MPYPLPIQGALTAIYSTRSLVDLDVGGHRMEGLGVVALAGRAEWEALNVSHSGASADSIPMLGGISALRDLGLNGTDLVDDALGALRLLRLERLGVSGTRIIDASVETIQGFHDLVSLQCEDVPVTREATERLFELPRLK